MMKQFFAFVLGCSLFLTACGTDQPAATDAHDHEGHAQHEGHEHHAQDVKLSAFNTGLYKEVIRIHDEVMPKMDALTRLHGDIKKMRSRMEEVNYDGATQEEALDLMKQLNTADEGMMTWMRNFKTAEKLGAMSEEEVTTYLNGEKTAIETVAKLMNQSMESAEAFLAKHGDVMAQEESM